MTQLDGTLSDLARLRSGSEPIVSLYLDTRWADEHQRQRVRLFVSERIRKILAHYLPDTPGYPGLERTLARLRDFVAGLTSQAYERDKNGVALFACESLNLWRVHTFRRSFQPELCVDGFPHLTQLARLADDFEAAIVVAPSPAGADVWRVSLGELAAEASTRGDVPRAERDEFNPGAAMHGVAHGRQYERIEKNVRNRDAFVQKNRKAAALEVTTLFDQQPGSSVVLVGTSEAVAAFERGLPERVREKVIARIPRPRGWDSGDGVRRDSVLAGAAQAVAAQEKVNEEEAIESVVGQSLRGGLAVLGPDDVVAALNQGRVHRLVLEEDFVLTGWRCDNCEALGANAEAAESCPYCGAHVHALQHLGEAIVARAVAEGGDVEIVAHANKLHSYRGVGAFLRQTSGTALRGVNQRTAAASAPGAGQP